MTINYILQDIKNIPQKAVLANRIHRCEPAIKKAIAELRKTGSFSPIQYAFITKQEITSTSLSTTELQKLYGMGALESLLFLDAIVKADQMPEKSRLITLLQTLMAGKHVQGPVITQEMLDMVKKTQPDVWAHYVALCEQVQKEEATSLEELDQNLKEEI